MLNSIEIGTRIKTRQKELGLRQKDLIELTNISHSALSNYTSGTRIPGAEELLKLSNALNTSIEWILIGEESTNVTLTEDEKELLVLFNQLSEKEQYKILGVLENKVKELKQQSDTSIKTS